MYFNNEIQRNITESANAAHHESFLKLLMDGSTDIDQLLEELSHHPRQDFQFSDN